jgi:uncharacterized cupin superfamily protein
MRGGTPEVGSTLRAAEGEWRRRGEQSPIEARDLGLSEASGGRIGSAQLRNTGDPSFAIRRHCHDNDLHFLYVLRGAVVLEFDGGPEPLIAGSACAMPALTWHEEYAFSGDFAGIMVTAPAVYGSVRDGDGLPDRIHDLDPDRRPIITHEPAPWLPRARDLGAGAATGGAIGLRVVDDQTLSPSACWLFVLEGGATIELDGGAETITAMDSAWLGRAQRTVASVQTGFSALELSLDDGAATD